MDKEKLLQRKIDHKLSVKQVLKRYKDEALPEFVELRLRDVNQHGIFGNTPLHVACSRGDQEEVKALLAGGAEINSIGELGNTPLHDAAGQGYIEIVELLLEKGAAPNIVNLDGNSPRDVARLLHHNDILALIDQWHRAKNKKDRGTKSK